MCVTPISNNWWSAMWYDGIAWNFQTISQTLPGDCKLNFVQYGACLPGVAEGPRNWGGTGVQALVRVWVTATAAQPPRTVGRRPCWGRVRRGSPPLATGIRGCHPRENFKIANAKFCILMHFQPWHRDLRPWMEAMRSVRVRRELPRKIGACGGLEPKSWTFLCM